MDQPDRFSACLNSHLMSLVGHLLLSESADVCLLSYNDRGVVITFLRWLVKSSLCVASSQSESSPAPLSPPPPPPPHPHQRHTASQPIDGAGPFVANPLQLREIRKWRLRELTKYRAHPIKDIRHYRRAMIRAKLPLQNSLHAHAVVTSRSLHPFTRCHLSAFK